MRRKVLKLFLAAVAISLLIFMLSGCNPSCSCKGENDAGTEENYVYENNILLTVGKDGLTVIDATVPSSPEMLSHYKVKEAKYVVHKNNYAFLDTSEGIIVLNMVNPSSPKTVQRFHENIAGSGEMYISGDYLYLANDDYLEIFDISDVPDIRKKSSFYIGNISDIMVEDCYAYIVSRYRGLVIVDISNKSALKEVGQINLGDDVSKLKKEGSYIYIVGRDMFIVNVSNPAAPELVSKLSENYYYLSDIEIKDELAYIAAGWRGVLIVDISDPAEPYQVGYTDTLGEAKALYLKDDYIFVADSWAGITTINAADPNNPIIVGNIDVGGSAVKVLKKDDQVYLLDDSHFNTKFFVFDVSDPSKPQIKSFISLPKYPKDLLIKDNYAFVLNGDLITVDVNDPECLRQVSNVDAGYTEGFDLKNNYLYIASDWYGVEVFDITDPSNPKFVLRYDTDKYSNDLKVSGDYVYVVDTDKLLVFNATDPSTLTKVGEMKFDRYDYYQRLEISGNYAYVANCWNDLIIIDISDPENPTEVASISGIYSIYDIFISGSYLYIAADYRDLYIYNISDPTNPVQIEHFNVDDDVDDVFVEGSYAYLANYHNGLTILDVSDPRNPEVVSTTFWYSPYAITGM